MTQPIARGLETDGQRATMSEINPDSASAIAIIKKPMSMAGWDEKGDMRKKCESATTPVDLTIVPTFRYVVQWNFGKSSCGFDTAKDASDFLLNDLPTIEKHCKPATLPTTKQA